MTQNNIPRIGATAAVLRHEIEQLGDSFEITIAKARIDEAVLWADRHIAVIKNRRKEERTFMDIFDRIANAIAEAKNNGTTDNPTYDAHLAALDQEYSDLKGTEAGDATQIATLNAGLQKIADAVNPPATGASATATTETPTPAAPAAAQATAQAAAPAQPAPAAAQASDQTNTGTVDTSAQQPAATEQPAPAAEANPTPTPDASAQPSA